MTTIPEQQSGTLGLNPNTNKKQNPYIPGSDLYVMQGWQLSESASISKRQGFAKLNTTQLLDAGTASAFTGLFEFIPSTGTPAKVATTTIGLYNFGTPVANAWNSINLSGVGGNRTGTYQNLYDVAMLQDQMYVGGGAGTDLNIRFNGTDAFKMGITPPISTPTVSAPQAGGSMTAGVYSFKVTYGNVLGQESNPSIKTADVTIVGGSGNYTINLIDIPVSPDPQVTLRNIYRTTADGAVWLLLATISNNTATIYSSTQADSSLGIAVEEFGNGVPPHFDKIEIFQGTAFMAGDPSNQSRIWFSANNKPACVDSNDFRDLDSNDGDKITGLRRFGPTVVAFKNNSIWNASGSDRYSFGFERRATTVGSINNASIVEIPLKNVLAFMSPDAKFYFYDGVDTQPAATSIEPILSSLNAGRLMGIVGCIVPSLNQARWLVSDGSSNYGNLIIWYDYILDKWGTTSVASTPGNYCTSLRDVDSKLKFYLGGIADVGAGIDGGYVWLGDSGGSDDGTNISVEVVDKGHPHQDPSPEDIKMFSHLFVWFKPNPLVTLNIFAYIDDPTGTPISLGSFPCTNTSGQQHVHFNLIGRRFYVRITESSTTQGNVLRGWKVYYKNVGRHNAP